MSVSSIAGPSSAQPEMSASPEIISSSYSLKDIEKLEGQSNFVRWRATIRKILDLEELLEVTISEQAIPVEAAHRKTLKKKNLNASLLMQGTIVKEQQYLISNCETAFAAWTNLHNAFDKQNTISSFYQIKAMHDLKHSDNISITEYIQMFGTMWSDLQNRLANSSETIAANAKALYDMDEYKTIVFLASLSSSMNDIVDNLQTLPNVTYADVISKLQAL
jgi:hypothetical protein